jgi:tetratricopeptide (TPR) repeat protein
MMNRKILIVLLSLLFVSAGIYEVVAQQTGTRIKGADSSYPEMVLWLDQPYEIDAIRLLLQEGKKERAVEKARDYVESLENARGVEAKQRRYYGLNALCAALTSTGELNEAIDTCNQAIALYPTSWLALNSRGTAYYVSGQIDLALKDYHKALSQVGASEAEANLIQHNISLAEAKKSNTN